MNPSRSHSAPPASVPLRCRTLPPSAVPVVADGNLSHAVCTRPAQSGTRAGHGPEIPATVGGTVQAAAERFTEIDTERGRIRAEG
jgi:hypothetical protein